MELTFTPRQRAFRAEVRDWLAAHVPAGPLPSMDTADGFARHRAWERALADAGLAAVSWPVEYGGRGAGLIDWLIFEEEYWAAGAPGRVGQNGIFLLAPTLLAYGTPEQKARHLPRMVRADDVWAQAWSEPEAGSDLASLRATATPDGDGWRLNGQKTWSSRAAYADWCFGLFRSDPGSSRHRGLTYFMLPLDSPGVTVRPIAQLDGEHGFAEIFFDDVRVGPDGVLGGIGQGWKVAMATTSSERGLTLRSPGRFMATADRLLDLARTSADQTLRDAAVRAWSDSEAYRLHTFAAAARLAEGEELGAASSLMKVFWSELDLRMHELALDLLGPRAPLAGRWLDGFLFALAGPIYAGTNEIQRNIIAERVLGLPR
ncbi:acyl-CoA dehydrogenase family protein [Actinomadura parmotrematis]|uniref:Acyl-CoA dehydrogenase family protein n=1 Tax=Actinomadura parmotrematis TaxID=2864039 RepID=A0ABS7FTJ3_9ACTN|nr:acyl-CoA dehydrogenase family protein [Actinomadura parmotrematis]MBW8483723.1 acyl-CoA dehydrogenase family protein [Actinomadura parmotrematis]